MNSHEDTKRDRHNVANNLIKTQQDLEDESAVRASLEATVQSLRDKLKFDAELHQKVRFWGFLLVTDAYQILFQMHYNYGS